MRCKSFDTGSCPFMAVASTKGYSFIELSQRWLKDSSCCSDRSLSELKTQTVIFSFSFSITLWLHVNALNPPERELILTLRLGPIVTALVITTHSPPSRAHNKLLSPKASSGLLRRPDLMASHVGPLFIIIAYGLLCKLLLPQSALNFCLSMGLAMQPSNYILSWPLWNTFWRWSFSLRTSHRYAAALSLLCRISALLRSRCSKNRLVKAMIYVLKSCNEEQKAVGGEVWFKSHRDVWGRSTSERRPRFWYSGLIATHQRPRNIYSITPVILSIKLLRGKFLSALIWGLGAARAKKPCQVLVSWLN